MPKYHVFGEQNIFDKTSYQKNPGVICSLETIFTYKMVMKLPQIDFVLLDQKIPIYKFPTISWVKSVPFLPFVAITS